MFTTDIVTLNDMSVNFLLYNVLKPSRKDRPLGKFEYRAYEDEKFGQEKIVCFRRSGWRKKISTGKPEKKFFAIFKTTAMF